MREGYERVSLTLDAFLKRATGVREAAGVLPQL
jgi:hypothetical protein